MEAQLAMCVKPLPNYGGFSGPLSSIEGDRLKFSLSGDLTEYQEGSFERAG
jgi:hypothetical protein